MALRFVSLRVLMLLMTASLRPAIRVEDVPTFALQCQLLVQGDDQASSGEQVRAPLLKAVRLLSQSSD